MKSFVLFIFFLGLLIIIHSIYEQKFENLKANKRVEYRFVPKTYYEEQIGGMPVSSMFKNMFIKNSVWQEQNFVTSDPKNTL